MFGDPVEVGRVKCLGSDLRERNGDCGVSWLGRSGVGPQSQGVWAEAHAKAVHSRQERARVREGRREQGDESRIRRGCIRQYDAEEEISRGGSRSVTVGQCGCNYAVESETAFVVGEGGQ